MNKRIKWGIIILIGAGLAGLGIYQFTPHENEELTAADALPKENKQRTLKVNAQVIKPHLLTDEILVTGRLVPDEEVSLSFETSGKITDIFFTEGTLVKRGELLAKVNDRQLQAQLKRLEAQIPLAEDRVFRQNALLKRDAVSKEAYEQVKTELATLFPLGHRFDTNILNANDIIAVCEIASLLMQEIPPLIGHFLMENSYAQPLFFSVVTSFLLVG